jgi:hypothetical protein
MAVTSCSPPDASRGWADAVRNATSQGPDERKLGFRNVYGVDRLGYVNVQVSRRKDYCGSHWQLVLVLAERDVCTAEKSSTNPNELCGRDRYRWLSLYSRPYGSRAGRGN